MMLRMTFCRGHMVSACRQSVIDEDLKLVLSSSFVADKNGRDGLILEDANVNLELYLVICRKTRNTLSSRTSHCLITSVFRTLAVLWRIIFFFIYFLTKQYYSNIENSAVKNLYDEKYVHCYFLIKKIKLIPILFVEKKHNYRFSCYPQDLLGHSVYIPKPFQLLSRIW